MSHLNDLFRELETREPALARDLRREVQALADRRAFGLNFERHVPEAVELPGRKVRKGDKVRVLSPRGAKSKNSDRRPWRVIGIDRSDGTATLELLVRSASDRDKVEATSASVDDLIVVAEFRDAIYPGLVSTGRVERGGDRPFHTVINAENYHALQTLLFAYRGRVDCIYIDPPYNTGARDWKYNNDYVESDDFYRHSKWLAMMERRLLLAKELLNPDESALIATIDEKEVLRLGVLLEQVFPEADIQMVTSVTNRAGSQRSGRFSRVEEHLFYVFIGTGAATKWTSTMLDEAAIGGRKASGKMPTVWFTAVRRGTPSALRSARPNLFYPVFIDAESGRFHSVGDPIPLEADRGSIGAPAGAIAIWPVHSDGTEQTWRFSAANMREKFEAGTARLGKRNRSTGARPITYLQPGTLSNIEKGVFEVVGRSGEGALELAPAKGVSKRVAPRTVWNATSHFARDHGSTLLKGMLGEKRFDFPKSLYAVEDALRFVVGNKQHAVILDFFAGSGTTAHAVMRLNKQDGGQRQAIVVTNNEVAADEQKKLRNRGHRPGDAKWEQWGICEYVTKPRIAAAVTGLTPEGGPISGDYKFTDEFPMAEGFSENVEFFTITYEAPLRVASNREFSKIAALLWLRAGSVGRRITDISQGWDVADSYGVLADLDQTRPFLT